MLGIGRVVYAALEPLASRIMLADRPHPYGLGELTDRA